MTITQVPSQLLKNALWGNTLFSTACGIVLSFESALIAPMIGVGLPGILVALGLGLIGYGVFLWLNARRATPNLTQAKIAIAADLVWVIAAAVIIMAGWLNSTGNWLLAGVTDVVLVCAILQWVGVRRLEKAA